jgi:hypothetical protein
MQPNIVCHNFLLWDALPVCFLMAGIILISMSLSERSKLKKSKDQLDDLRDIQREIAKRLVSGFLCLIIFFAFVILEPHPSRCNLPPEPSHVGIGYIR